MKPRTVAFCLYTACLAAVAYGQLRERPANPRPGSYRVTTWPDHKSADQDYNEEIEAYLNKMATDGWRFHSEMSGQFGRMMVFEGVTSK
jgi:hypothetical protein